LLAFSELAQLFCSPPMKPQGVQLPCLSQLPQQFCSPPMKQQEVQPPGVPQLFCSPPMKGQGVQPPGLVAPGLVAGSLVAPGLAVDPSAALVGCLPCCYQLFQASRHLPSFFLCSLGCFKRSITSFSFFTFTPIKQQFSRILS
jgi:hypothetical protein